MESKTPQFDKALDEILSSLVPHTRVCKWKGEHKHCEGEFKIEEGDIEFLKLLRAPAPNFCPTCRRMRRLTNLNNSRLFVNKCDAPLHNESMISIFSKECPFPVYDYKYFISDEFDPFSFGVDYKNSNSPMEQLMNLRKKFPMPSFLNRDPSSTNSDYSNGGKNLKNGYYVWGCYNTENAWYSVYLNKCTNIMDSKVVVDSEYVYESVFSNHLYKSSFIYFSDSCIESFFLFDCRNCQDCFGCVNLRNSRYCVYNEQLSKEGYEDFLKSVYPLSRKKLSVYEEKFWELVKKLPMNGSRNIASTNVSGVNIKNSRDVFDTIDSNYSENIRHSDAVIHNNNSMDIMYSGGYSSLLYMNANIGSHSSRVKFSVSSKLCTDCEFIFNSKNCNDCFMCFGLQNKSYCILNKQYEEEEYFKIIDEIKSDMLKRGEYNDGPDLSFSAQAYNFSLADISYPLNNEEILKLGGYIARESDSNVGDMKVVKYSELPENIEEVMNDITEKAILCEKSGRPFKIISSELEFYRIMKLSLPDIHPSLRIEKRNHLVPDGKKYKAFCSKCSKNIETVFNPEEKYNFYCEDCYKREVI
ncbi:MAG: hypothetical protein WCW54_04070 [Candidatus Paceibacterota bacterium]